MRRDRGQTLIETLTAVALTAVTLLVGLGLFIFGLVFWARGQGKIDVELGSQQAVRSISLELREAMSVTLDSDGQGLTYMRPTKDSSGAYSVPLISDGVVRRIQLSNGVITMVTAGKSQTLCSSVITTDPTVTGNPAYSLFKVTSSGIVRALNVTVICQVSPYEDEKATSRSRETIFLRNAL